MFATFEESKFPVQLDDKSTVWRCVEIVMNAPSLLVTLEEDDIVRYHLLQGGDDLLQVIEAFGPSRVTGVHIVLPPDMSPSGDWAILPVSRVELEPPLPDGSSPGAILTTRDGQQYGGFPLETTHTNHAHLAVLLDLPKKST